MAVSDIYSAVMNFDDERVADLVRQEIRAGTDVQVILDEGMVGALDVIGQEFSDGVIFVPQMLMAADAVKAGMDIVRPLLADTGVEPVGKVVLGTVKGDLHDIGKNMVAMMLEGAGFQVIDLGVNVSLADFTDAAQEHAADIVALSALLTTSMPAMGATVAAVREAAATHDFRVRVMVGGPPVNDEFAAKIGADGYGVDAPGAVRLARRLIGDDMAAHPSGQSS